ncbi:uncharacterized protein A1O9_09369 [Exophiala aquamarina CBS 119918]|uniref:Uncharacterized protein n=1 Tax=Exophiala aquamarina CBS 119918 TaxID=1182545 RepID=A0A072P4Z1_9EURO|nr:uncharacterized protein A1O9_09369 [Exophiala aquamarina CBS 119918]KEF54926.1 hypothetical protein A1O9_09369 [Exophiala aquamarina CBS 119918]
MLGKLRSSFSHRDKAQQSKPSAPPGLTERKSSSGSALDWVRRKSSGSVATLSVHRASNADLTPTVKGETGGPANNAPNRLGLDCIHGPSSRPIANIIFVHGLGGHSTKTWSHNHDPDFFWPQLWLPKDPKLARARLFTYGYDSQVLGLKSVANITDFAKALLFDMRHKKCNGDYNLRLGEAPIIFVAHSMGGLVVKKAFILAQDDEHCKTLVKSMAAVIFFSTPHRGSDLANTLDLILTLIFQPARQFLKELAPQSSAIEDINEQFRHIAWKLSIISFHETYATSIAGSYKMIVTKDSALLGYENEESRGLPADHHTVCKFENDEDPSYIIVRDVLRGLVDKFSRSIHRTPSTSTSKLAEEVRKALDISRMPADDLKPLRKRWVSGSCEWILKDASIQTWMTDQSRSQLVWYTAPPASGKSVLSSYIFYHLQTNGYDCQFYFFDYRDQTRRSIVGLLKSLAYQISCEVPEFAAEVIATLSEDNYLNKSDYRLLWQRLFQTLFFDKDFKRPVYWVIDGLDESESPDAVIELLEELILRSRATMKVLVTGRHSEALALRFKKLQRQLRVDMIDAGGQMHNAQDIELLVARELDLIPGGPSLKSRLQREILQRARGNFLWVSLVIEELQMCQTERETTTALEQMPEDITRMYERMELSIIKGTSDGRLGLAKELLQWAVCVPQPLKTVELIQAIGKDYDDILDLGRTIREVCGQFVVIDSTDHVTTVHQTARDFLTKRSKSAVAIHRQNANSALLVKTLSSLRQLDIRKTALGSKGQKQVRKELETEQPFVLYGTNSWIYHLGHADPLSDRVLDALEGFFNSPCVLDWIFVVAILNQVRTLARAGKGLLSFIAANRKLNNSRNPLLHRLSTVELLENWAGDLVRLTAKFNKQLITQPYAIYETIPALCPSTSTINRQFRTSKVVLTGQSDSWSDIFARNSLPQHEVAIKIISLGIHLAVLSHGGKVYVWSSVDFGEVCTLRHGEAVTNMCMNLKGNILVTYGLTTTKVWDLPEGIIRLQVANQANGRALSVAFAMNDQRVIAATDDRSVRILQLTDDEASWRIINPALLKEESQSQTTIINSPSYMAINPGGTQIGVCYRSFPLTIWDLDSASVVSRCMRPGTNLDSPQMWFPVELFAWNPISGHIVGWYKGKTLFKWHPITNETHEVSASVDELVVSPNGKVFVTSDSNGTVKVWNFAFFAAIYQLSSGDLVSGLSFSPDSARFYDIRGATINAWEPNGLVRLVEAEDSFSDTSSDDQRGTVISHVSEADARQYTALSILAAAPNGLYYATGNEDGEVHITDMKTSSRSELTRFNNFQPVTHLTWDSTSSIIAVADLAADICILRLSHWGHGQLESAVVEQSQTPRFDLEGRAIHQLLLDFSSRLLLVVTSDLAQTWDIDEGRLKDSVQIIDADQRNWLNHAGDNKLFMGVGPENIHVHQWEGLHQIFEFKFNTEKFPLIRQSSTFSDIKPPKSVRDMMTPSEAKPTRYIMRAMLTQDEKHILVHIKEHALRSRMQNRLFAVPATALEIPKGFARSCELDCLQLADELTQGCEFTLGVLSGGRLVFLDRDLWVCSMKLTRLSKSCPLVRHYFIPRDWTDVEGLKQCSMLKDGVFLCPQEGNIVTVKTNFDVIGH